jgi:hypothetical protein
MQEISEFADFMRKSGKRRALAPIDPFLPETKTSSSAIFISSYSENSNALIVRPLDEGLALKDSRLLHLLGIHEAHGLESRFKRGHEPATASSRDAAEVAPYTKS